MAADLPDPWNFADEVSTVYSPNGTQRLEYRELYEKSQGGPLSGNCFWVTVHGQRVQLPGSCGGPPVWEPQGYRVVLPLWSTSWGADQQLTILDTQLRKLAVFRQGFDLLCLQSFNGLLVSGLDNPIYKPRPVNFNAGAEAIQRIFEL
jgi:hypothetical protein